MSLVEPEVTALLSSAAERKDAEAQALEKRNAVMAQRNAARDDEYAPVRGRCRDCGGALGLRSEDSNGRDGQARGLQQRARKAEMSTLDMMRAASPMPAEPASPPRSHAPPCHHRSRFCRREACPPTLPAAAAEPRWSRA